MTIIPTPRRWVSVLRKIAGGALLALAFLPLALAVVLYKLLHALFESFGGDLRETTLRMRDWGSDFGGWWWSTTSGVRRFWLVHVGFTWHAIFDGDERDRDERESSNMQPRYLLQGAPAVIAILLALATWAALTLRTTQSLAEQHEQDARRAIASHDLPTALLAYTRLVDDAPLDAKSSFALATVAETLGQTQRAEALFASLSPRDKLGHTPAHLRQAQELMSLEPLSEEAAATAEGHLLRVLSEEPDLPPAHALMARLRIHQQKADQALPHLLKAVDSDPRLRLALARVYASRGQSEGARREAQKAMDIFRKLTNANLDDKQARLNWAESLVMLGELETAEKVLREGLALDPTGPCVSALVSLYMQWTNLVAADRGAPPQVRQRTLQQEIEILKQYAPDTPETHGRLAGLLWALGKQAESVEKLAFAAERHPSLDLEVARLYTARGDHQHAQEWARKGADYYRDQVAKEPSSILPRLRQAEALVLSKDFSAAAAVLREGFETNRDRRYESARSLVYLAWWDESPLNSEPAAAPALDRLELLSETLKCDPWNLKAVHRLLEFGRTSEMAADQVRDMLRSLLAQGDAPAAAHLLLGTDAMLHGQTEAGMQHLEQAYQLDPRALEITNNLAWSLAHAETPDLPRALELVNSALKRDPQQLTLYDTRGRILAKSGKWKEALADLEKCLKLMHADADFHDILAQAYDQVKLPELAKEHKNQASQLRKATTPVRTELEASAK